MATYELAKQARTWWDKAQDYHRRFAPGRDALYALCASARHDELEATVSKLWLIGRSHSAALERTHIGPANRKKEPYWRAAKGLSERLDERLDAIRVSEDRYDEEHVEAIAECVDMVTGVFEKVVGQRKLSLATKYLHFHIPAIPIYDSVSNAVYRSFVDRRGQGDGRYRAHLKRFRDVRDQLRTLGHAPVTARTVDNFAMYWWFD